MEAGTDQSKVLEQARRIAASPDFTAGPRTQKFFLHLVSEELEGRGEELRGTALAMDLFGRGADFDSNSDPVVRVEAGRLRKALEHYYLTSGSRDDLVIDIPKGQYRPVLTTRTPETEPSPSAHRRELPTLVVFPLETTDTDRARLYGEGLPDEIALELGRFSGLQVVSANRDADNALAKGDYRLGGSVRDAGGALRITMQLTNAARKLVWSDRYRIGENRDDVFDVQEDIARRCATSIADAYGAVSEDLSALYTGRKAEDSGVFEALLAFHAHMRTARRQSCEEFSNLAAQALQDNPESGLANALSALSFVEMASLGLTPIPDAIEAGSGFAERAIALSPNCQEALFAAAVFSDARGDHSRFLNLVDRAVAANPNGTLLTALAGGWIARSEDMMRGIGLVRDAQERNPLLPIWTNVSLALAPFVEGRFQEASNLVKGIDARDVVYDWILIGAMHRLAENDDLADQAMERVKSAGVDPLDYVRQIGFLPEILAKVETALVAR